MSPEMTGAPAAGRRAAGAQRVLEALFPGVEKIEREKQEIELDARCTVSDREVLEKKDFAQMSAAEIAAAKDAIKRAGAAARSTCSTRRLAPHPRGHLHRLRRTLRASMKARRRADRPEISRAAQTKTPPIVALLDISGSMSQYTRLFLHFLHAVTDARKRVTPSCSARG